MHLADAFIQSDLHCIQVTVFTFDQLLLSLGIEPMILALLAPCSTIWATGKFQKATENIYIYIHTPLQKYWNSEANSFIFAVDWKHLGLTSKDEYEIRD